MTKIYGERYCMLCGKEGKLMYDGYDRDTGKPAMRYFYGTCHVGGCAPRDPKDANIIKIKNEKILSEQNGI